MKSLLAIPMLLLATAAFGQEPIAQSTAVVSKYVTAINKAAKGVDPTKGTVIDRIIKVYKSPAEKLGYDFDKTYRLTLVDGVVNMSLYQALVQISTAIEENKDEALSKKLISDKTYRIMKTSAEVGKAANVSKANPEMFKAVMDAVARCADKNAGVCDDKKLQKVLNATPMFRQFIDPGSLANELSRVDFQLWGSAGLITTADGGEINTNSFFNEGDEEAIEFRANKEMLTKLVEYKSLVASEKKTLLKQ